ncbi:P-loop NTPase fold protein [Vibrio alginolyticus]|uniref:P-loop NTPase fold protein n=1 Tax=Vibrio alginolyticus TaxID=663 RepID=UPI003754FB66
MSSFSQIITHHLKEKDFPPIVAINGDWGVGKTFYIKNSLIADINNDPELSKLKVEYISLIGVNSLNDFKDKLISRYYLNNHRSAGRLKNIFDGALKYINVATKSTDDAASVTAITSIINGSRGAIKESILNKIKNSIFIIDDLERVSDKNVISQVLGECLDLTNNDNVKFIVSFNKKNHAEEILGDEKYFSIRVELTKTSDELVDLVLPGGLYKSRGEIKDAVEDLKIKNIRILKRILSKLVLLHDFIEENEVFDLDGSMTILVNQCFRIGFCHLSEGRSADEIKELISGDDIPSSLEGVANVTGLLIDFVCGRTVNINDNENLGILPRKKDSLDKIILFNPYDLNPNDYENGISFLKDFIVKNSSDETPMIKWYLACQKYIYLTKYGYIKDDINLERNIEEIEDGKNFFIERDTYGYRKNAFENEVIAKRYAARKEIIIKNEKKKEVENLLKDAMRSWKDVDQKFYDLYEGKNLFCEVDSDTWLRMIIKWKPEDIGYFASFIYDRHKNNHYDNNVNEREALRELSTKLKKHRRELSETGQKVGAINTVIERLDKSANTL